MTPLNRAVQGAYRSRTGAPDRNETGSQIPCLQELRGKGAADRVVEMVPVGLLVLLAFAVVLAVVGARTQETTGSGRATGRSSEAALTAATGSHSPVVPARPDHSAGIRSNLGLTLPLVGLVVVLFCAWGRLQLWLRTEQAAGPSGEAMQTTKGSRSSAA